MEFTEIELRELKRAAGTVKRHVMCDRIRKQLATGTMPPDSLTHAETRRIRGYMAAVERNLINKRSH